VDELRAYEKLHDEPSGFVNKMDTKDYGIGAQILRNLGVHKMKLLSNTSRRRKGIIGYGLEITDTIPILETTQA
jgi:GTP cyclohydrolase II